MIVFLDFRAFLYELVAPFSFIRAQELTESSIKESDEMVDQLERAEVAEEKLDCSLIAIGRAPFGNQ